jgi:hypothetical protein
MAYYHFDVMTAAAHMSRLTILSYSHSLHCSIRANEVAYVVCLPELCIGVVGQFYYVSRFTSVGNYSCTCGDDVARSGSSQLSEQVTTFQRVSKKRKDLQQRDNNL